jgi:hypothetical protein
VSIEIGHVRAPRGGEIEREAAGRLFIQVIGTRPKSRSASA